MPRSLPLLSLFCAICLAAWGGTALAQPDPGQSTVPTIRMEPTGSLSTIVVVRDAGGTPLSGATVEIVFSPEADGLVCWCVGQVHPVITAATNGSGEATFFISAGGCIDPSQLVSSPAIEVFADGIKLAEVGAVSPDTVDPAGLLPWQGWNPGGSCVVGIQDATWHVPNFSLLIDEFCSDFDGDGTVTMIDAVLLTPSIVGASNCTQQ